VLNVLVPEVSLKCSGVVSLRCQREATGVPQHVQMHFATQYQISEMWCLTMIDEARDFYLQADRQSVEAWAAWHLPYDKLTPAQCRYRASLRNAIKGLAKADGLRATYSSDEVTRNLDTENILFYNVGASPFRNTATRMLCFDRRCEQPPAPPKQLAFTPRHHVKYQTETKDNPFEPVGRVQLAHCGPVSLKKSELRELPRLWWLFKNAMKLPGTPWSLGDPFGVQLCIKSPAVFELNLAGVVKPLMDAFITALHYYEGNQLNDIADRVATLLGCPAQDVADRSL
jgi:hypothetical protein